MVTTVSANQVVLYNKVYYNYTLEKWVEIIHKYNSLIHHWKYYKLAGGEYGFDNILLSLYLLFENSKEDELKEDNMDHLSHLIHEGWIINYIYWRDNEPWLINKDYIKPSTPLGDKRRNECASTKYCNLSEEEKEKDRIIVKCVLQNIH